MYVLLTRVADEDRVLWANYQLLHYLHLNTLDPVRLYSSTRKCICVIDLTLLYDLGYHPLSNSNVFRSISWTSS